MLQLVNINNDIGIQAVNIKKRWTYHMPFGELKFKETSKSAPLPITNSYDNMACNLTSSIGFTSDYAFTLSVNPDQISLTTNNLEERIMYLENQVRTLNSTIDDILGRSS